MFVLMFVSVGTPIAIAWESEPQALGSLQSYTGILQLPTARVKQDGTIRIKLGHADPWTYYGGAAGFLDQIEIHGQFTKVNTIEAFPGHGYGDYKDRSAGIRGVLIKENPFFPQVAAGLFDVTGTGLFSSRYLAMSKMIKNVDFTIGLGQGTLAGEFTGEEENFITSDIFRKTKLFGGVEWHLSPRLTLVAEYTTMNNQNMFGYRDSSGQQLKTDGSRSDINIGVKYKLTKNMAATLGYLQGDSFACSVDVELPLRAEGILPWRKTPPYSPTEKSKWKAFEADNPNLATILGNTLKAQGFEEISVSCASDVVWVAFHNTLHLSNSRALGHVADVCDRILPQRITTFYLNIKHNNTILTSLKTPRKVFTAFRDHNLDREGFLAYSKLNLYEQENLTTFQKDATDAERIDILDSRFSFSIAPQIITFVNNKEGFLKHKGFLRAQAGYHPWPGGEVLGELQWTIFNEFDEVDYPALEGENSVRTDLLDYEAQSDLRLSMLALEQKLTLPLSVQGRLSAGAFESAYAGFGGELFRYFNKGLWGIGLESELVRKRDPDNNLQLRDDPDRWYSTAFLHLYGQLLPSQGIDAGLTIGRFLAGDNGFRIDIRRSFDYFTLGAWYTKTDTDMFNAPENSGTDQKGVYISFPLSIFRDNDKPGHLSYAITSFTRDPGAMVRQPDSLFPMSPWITPDHACRTIEEMRRY
ncbi:YjbH domain-containing protein [Desulfocicer niacini]